jgi:hypothetical protein
VLLRRRGVRRRLQAANPESSALYKTVSSHQHSFLSTQRDRNVPEFVEKNSVLFGTVAFWRGVSFACIATRVGWTASLLFPA